MIDSAVGDDSLPTKMGMRLGIFAVITAAAAALVLGALVPARNAR